jgi:hypothetical protein
MPSALNLDNGVERFNICLESNGDLSFKANAENCAGTTRVTINDDTGNVGIGTTNPAQRLHIQGNRLRLENAGKRVDLRADGAAVDLQSETSDLYLRSTGAGHDIIMNPFGSDGRVGIGLQNPQAKLHVNGDMIVTGDITLPNADCAEEFAVKHLEMIEPGTVMVLGEEGSLCQSTEAYDKKVAGVVSGAGDLKPGLILYKQSESTNRMPIALMGKVYCKVDADYAPIEVGDLLTTSPTAGHAMKATDPLQAFGTIIGKALRPLETGKGLIPILVALQ